ncbi:MAG TPA: glycoside hydrolase family 3 C-terminal domain-containing protein, partial [Herpetosiphonaceae bacterium]|nr:glycoside hydrolase family 3 C-terminal domain-containing protein [Herpetosiphonaceae bacterium]
ELEDLVQSIVYVWYPGQAGGQALADVLFGRAAPSGRLPMTFPRSLDQLPPYEDYSMAGRTYRYATAEPLYPFGFGLSYASFAYEDLRLDKESLKAGDSLAVSCRVTNKGSVAAEEVVQVYISDLAASVSVPLQRLVAFQRVLLEPGQTKEVTFNLGPETMMLVDDEGQWRLEPGAFRLTVGGCSPGERGLELGTARPVDATFSVIE